MSYFPHSFSELLERYCHLSSCQVYEILWKPLKSSCVRFLKIELSRLQIIISQFLCEIWSMQASIIFAVREETQRLTKEIIRTTQIFFPSSLGKVWPHANSRSNVCLILRSHPQVQHCEWTGSLLSYFAPHHAFIPNSNHFYWDRYFHVVEEKIFIIQNNSKNIF